MFSKMPKNRNIIPSIKDTPENNVAKNKNDENGKKSVQSTRIEKPVIAKLSQSVKSAAVNNSNFMTSDLTKMKVNSKQLGGDSSIK